MILYKLNNTNRLSWWKIEQDGSGYTIQWGQDLSTINQMSSNINFYDTPTAERAAFEMQSRINEQINRRGYSEEIPKTVPDFPMLAQQWKDHIGKNHTPFKTCALQPKLDGLRCIATNSRMTTRRNEAITSCPHIEYILQHLDPEHKLDGELIIPNCDLQTIQSYVSRQRPHQLSKEIEYHIFDYIDLEMPFWDRYLKLRTIVKELMVIHADLAEATSSIPAKLRQKLVISENCPIKLVTTVHVDAPSNSPGFEKTLVAFHQDAVNAGFEGAIIRNNDAPYELNYRSPNLLKYKQRMDAEFEIIDISEGHGNTGIFVCRTSDGKIFEATPAWTNERKRYLLRARDKYIGRWVTVEYEKMSKDQIPLKPVAKCTREKPEE